MINLKKYNITNITVTEELLSAYINNFWNDVFSSIGNTNKKHLLLMCKVEFSDSSLGYRTLGHLRRVNFTDKELFIKFLFERLAILNESYTVHPISKIVFTYVIVDGLAGGDRRLLQDSIQKSIVSHRFNNMNLPISMDPLDYGKLVATTQFSTFVRHIVTGDQRTYQIDVSLDGLVNNVSILGASVLNWIDTYISGGFKREIGKSTIYFKNGEIVLRKQQLSAKAITKLNKDKVQENYFVTMDIETITENNKKIPYLIAAYNGSNYVTSFGKNQIELFSSFIKQLLTFFNNTSNKLLVVYAHNLSDFDGIFLLKHLLSQGKVEPVLFNGKLMSIKLRILSGEFKGKTIIFKDSLLLLPLSLRKLCVAFNVPIPKGYFPFKMTNIFYTGLLPKIEFWSGIDFNVYETIAAENKNKMWSFQAEAIKYCKLDCKCLHDILTNFNELVFKHFSLNIHVPLTLPALAMKIYRVHFMPENTIYQLVGKIESVIRQSYSGGAVDVYIPSNRITKFFSKGSAIFKKLFVYDVNSLFPYVMAHMPIPIGIPKYFEGDIRALNPKAFGFFYCKITSNRDLDHPILQRRILTSKGYRTIAGLGSWSAWICSTEMDNAMKFGYQFEILSGYQFDTGDIFHEYVTTMYNLRLEFPKGHAMNLVAKFLMNSLYGKFGMRSEFTKMDIFNTLIKVESNLLDSLIKVAGDTIHDFIKIGHHIIVIRDAVVSYKSESDDFYHGQDINIAIASTITAGARVHMSYFKNNPKFNL